MNYVFLSPDFPSHYYRFCSRLKSTGSVVLGVGETPHANLRTELRDALAEYVHIQDLHRYDEVIRALGYLTWRHGKLDGLDSHNEHWLETEARLREDFNIDGLRTANIPAAKRKSVMKEAFRRAGLPVARGQLFDGIETARAFAREIGYPIVAKPDSGVGANDTHILRSDDEMESFLQGSPAGYFLEEFVPGRIQTFDGLADRRGEPVYFASLEYRGVLDMVRDEVDTSYYTLRQLPNDLVDAGKAALKAFHIRSRFFHLEYFRTPDDRLLALEANLRPPGGLTIDMFNFASDIDLYQLWAEVVTGSEASNTIQRPYHCGYVGRKAYKRYVHSHEEILARCGSLLASHQPMDPVFHGAMGDYAYLVRSPNLDQIHELTAFIHERE